MHPSSSRSESAAPPESRLGTIIQGEYHLDGLFSEDELGPVYDAHNPRRKGRFAVQMLRREISPPLRTMLAVRDDLRRARELLPMGVLPTEQLADDHGTSGFATEILPGETLRQRLGRGAMPVEQALALVRVVGRALDALHAAGLIHGDLRPENVVLVDPEAKGVHAGRALLIGHGLHHLRHPDKAMHVDRLRYCPPELLAGDEKIPGPRGDVFALGALLYECLAGQPAFAGDSAEAVAEKLAQPRLSLPEDPSTGLSAELVRTLNVVIAGACTRDAQARTPRPADLVAALGQVARGAGLAWPEEGTAQRDTSLVRRLSSIFAGRPPQPPRPAAPSPGRVAVVARPEPAAERVASTVRPEPAAEPASPKVADALHAERAPTKSVPPSRPPSTPRPASHRPASREPTPHRAAPPPIPAAAARPSSGQKDRSAPPELPQSWLQRESTILLFRSDLPERPMRAADISQLVVAVQEGRMDPITAVQQAQRGEEVSPLQERLQPVLRLLSEHRRAALAAAAVAFLLMLLLLSMCLR